MLHDALPLLRKICIDKSSQMNLAVASRFRDIREIRISCLFQLEVMDEGTEDEFKNITVDLESKNSVVPFLSRFDSLELVHFGMKNEDDGKLVEGVSPVDCYFYEGDDAYPYEGDRDRLKSCLDLMSAAYKCGSIPQNLQISGLCCPDATNRNGFRRSDCEICTRACQRFPLTSVAEFECRGSSMNNAQSFRMFGLDVCLEQAQVENIIESRGGKDLLRSEKRLLHLLGRGRRYVVTGEEEGKKALHIVKYKEEELDEIKRAIEYASLDVKKLHSTTITNAIMRSFALDGNRLMPLEEQCYISETSLDHLIDKLCLPISKKDFERPLADLMKHTEKIVCVLNQCDAEVNDEGTEEETEFYEDLRLDFLKLIRRFLEVENNPPIELVASNGATCLINCLVGATEDSIYQLEAAHSLMNILVKGTDGNKKMVVDAGTIASFSRLLESSKDCIVEVSLLSLFEVATNGTIDDITTNAIQRLVEILDSKDKNDWVEKSLRVLVASKDHIKDNMNASLLPPLVKIMKMKAAVNTDMIVNSSILLRQVLEGDNPPVRLLINDFEAVPLILEIMEQTEKDDTVRMNLAHVIIVIGRALDSNMCTHIFEKTSFISVLVSLVESKDSDISEGAISAVGSVANKVFSPSNAWSMNRAGLPFSSVSCRDLVIKAGIMKPLIRVLGSSSTRPALSPSAMNQRSQQSQQAAGAQQQQVSGGVRSTDSKSSSSSSDTASSNSSSASILNVASWTFKCCCRGEPFDSNTLKSCLEILPSLFVKEDQVVVDNSCWALFHILDGLKRDELIQVIDNGFLEPLLQLLPFAPHNTQLPLLKALHLMSTAGDTCVKSIINLNGISCISKALYSPLAANQELGLNIIAKILAIDQDQILDDDAMSPR